MEQARGAKDRGQAEAWVGLAPARADVAVDKGEVVVDRGEEVVLRRDRAVIASALSVAKEQPINWGFLVTSSNVPSAERP